MDKDKDSFRDALVMTQEQMIRFLGDLAADLSHVSSAQIGISHLALCSVPARLRYIANHIKDSTAGETDK